MAAGSGLDDLLGAAGIDPRDGVQVVGVHHLAGAPVDPGLPLVLLAAGAVEADAAPVLPGRHARRTPLEVLRALYPERHELRPLPGGAPRPLAELTDDELTGGSWLVPALGLLDNLASPHGMAAISARLRAPDGCPWDRRQTHASLRPFLLEEAYETVDVLDRGATAELAEELGDLFLQVVLHAQLAAEDGDFDLTDVYRRLGEKIVRRHPHVFGHVTVSGADEVIRNWEAIKAGEQSGRASLAPDEQDVGEPGGEPSVEPAATAFRRVARALPALAASREIQERASALGWDWPDVEGVWEKVNEELAELHEAGRLDTDAGRDQRLHELGDVLFAAVNLARWLHVDPEEALRAANRRWIDRYEVAEQLATARGERLVDLSAEEKDRLWNEAKRR